MKLFSLTVLCLLQYVNGFSLNFDRLTSLYLPYTYTPRPQYELGNDAAEQMAFDAKNKILYSVGAGNIHVIEMTEVSLPHVLHHVSYMGVDATDIEVCGDFVFVTFANETSFDNGFLDIYRVYDRATSQFEHVEKIIVGDVPDMVYLTSDCSTALVAVEGEIYEDPNTQQVIDRPGGVAVIIFNTDPTGLYKMDIAGFDAFNDRVAELERSGVRFIYKGNSNTFANDVEPEYIALNEDETKAYISLQENNAIAVLDIATATITDIYGLGFKDWGNLTMDPSDRDSGINMGRWPVYGMYMPDAIRTIRIAGVDYLISANEGDSKDYDFFSEEVRVKDLPLSTFIFGNVNDLQKNGNLGRLKVTTENGKNPTTNEYEAIYTFGGRSFSIWRADTMSLVYDSGDEISRKTAELEPELFNCNFDPTGLVADEMDTRSDDKASETESITYGRFGDYIVLFLGNERPGTIAAYVIDERLDTVTPVFQTLLHGVNRTSDTWGNLYNQREVAMLDPEDILFVPSSDSPNGEPLLLVSGSHSGTISVIQITVDFDEEIVGRK